MTISIRMQTASKLRPQHQTGTQAKRTHADERRRFNKSCFIGMQEASKLRPRYKAKPRKQRDPTTMNEDGATEAASSRCRKQAKYDRDAEPATPAKRATPINEDGLRKSASSRCRKQASYDRDAEPATTAMHSQPRKQRERHR